MKRKHDIVTVEASKRMEGDDVLAVSIGNIDEHGREVWHWLPKSQIEDHHDGTFSMPEWLAIEKGLI